ncbi:hypothetical protein OSTOST_18953 [Ostertagia ostertagi]
MPGALFDPMAKVCKEMAALSSPPFQQKLIDTRRRPHSRGGHTDHRGVHLLNSETKTATSKNERPSIDHHPDAGFAYYHSTSNFFSSIRQEPQTVLLSDDHNSTPSIPSTSHDRLQAVQSRIYTTES